MHFDIEYFPIDEAHPDFTTDAYSFSKRILEETAAYFWRREAISGVQLRFPLSTCATTAVTLLRCASAQAKPTEISRKCRPKTSAKP